MIYLEKDDFIILQSILKKYPYNFCAFGSRVTGRNHKFSDLDLCVMEDIANNEMSKLINELEESDISIHVDLKRYWCDMNDDFRSLIVKDLTPL